LPGMKRPESILFRAAVAAGVLAFAPLDQAYCADSPPDNSQVLLQKVKQGVLDRRIAIKQTEIERLKEDLEKSKKDMDALSKNLDATTALIANSSGNLDELAADQKRYEQTLELTELRIEAERKKNEGLKRLSAAQGSALAAINQRMAELDVRDRVREAEVQLLSQGKAVPGEDNDEEGTAELHKLRKTLASDESKTVTAENVAREAMKGASAKLELANEAAARANQMADGMAKEKLEPVGEAPSATAPSTPKGSPTPKKTAPKQ